MKHVWMRAACAVTVGVAAMTMPVQGGAQAPSPASVWGQALSQAWARAPAQQVAAARAQQAQAEGELARRLTPAPATVSVGTLNDRLHHRRGRNEWEAEVATPIWLPGQRAAREAWAAAQAEQWGAELGVARWTLAGELREAGWALATAREQVALAQARLEAARALQADVQRRVRAGESARLDGHLATADARWAEAELAEAERARDDAQARWQALTGADAPAAWPVEAPPRESSEVLLRQHPRKRAAQSALRLARARWDLAEASQRAAPEVALRVLRERDDAREPYANAVGLRLSVPLSSAPQRLRDTAEPRAQWLQAQADDALLDPQLALDLAAAQRAHEAVTRRLALARERGALLGETLQLLEKSFALGERDLPMLLRARSAAFEAQAEQRRLELAQAAAQSRIQQALGVLP